MTSNINQCFSYAANDVSLFVLRSLHIEPEFLLAINNVSPVEMTIKPFIFSVVVVQNIYEGVYAAAAI